MAGWLSLINRLLPFATPGTPLIQDLLHLAALSALLYFAPQIQEHFQRSHHAHEAPHPPGLHNDIHPDLPTESTPTYEPPPQPTVEEDDASDTASSISSDEDTNAPALLPELNNANLGPQPLEAGPANNPAPNRPLPPTRQIGAKKAKSLARRDQRRAYHEFQRAQGDAQRAAEASTAEAREAALAVERERRRAVEVEVEARRKREREERREVERREREEEVGRREQAVEFVREALEERGWVDLLDVVGLVGGNVDEGWVRGIVMGSGLVGRRDGVVTMVTGRGWVVRVREEDMRVVFERAAEVARKDGKGRVTVEEIGRLLEDLLRQKE